MYDYHTPDEDVSQQANVIFLEDEKFNWKEKKEQARMLAGLLRWNKDMAKAQRADFCASYLEYYLLEADDMGWNLDEAVRGKKQLSRAIFCQLRVCPVCNARRSRKLHTLLAKCMNGIKAEHDDVRYLMLTLSIKNCTGADLSDTMTYILNAFHKLMRRRPVQRAIKGYFRTLEITYNTSANTYHPHLHIMLAVEPEYFKRSSGLYITQDQWITFWKESLQVDYKPTAHIQKADASPKSISEVTKYVTKDSAYFALMKRGHTKQAADLVDTLLTALHGRRLIQTGGWFKDHWDVSTEGDLVATEADDDVHGEWYAQYNYSARRFMDYYLERIYKKTNRGYPDQETQIVVADYQD